MMGTVALAMLVTVILAMMVTAVAVRRTSKVSFVDAAWGAAFACAAVVGGVVATVGDSAGTPVRRWLLVGLVVVWGGRLTLHLGRRVVAAEHDDPRYEAMLGGTVRSVPFAQIVMKVFALQGILIALVLLPVLAGITDPVSAWWPVGLGVFVWLIGFVFEAVADAQLAAHRANPDRPAILTTGIWAWTRHPNYFGDACVWWGLWLIGGAASGLLPALSTILAPVLMTWILTAVSGVRLAERRMAGRTGWAFYSARTPIFVPRPPRRKAAHQSRFANLTRRSATKYQHRA